jgi:hypothetical protein
MASKIIRFSRPSSLYYYMEYTNCLKERFYPILVKKILAHFNQIKENRLMKVNSKTSKLESNDF